MDRLVTLAVLCLVSIGCGHARVQDERGVVTLTGEVGEQLRLSVADLESFPTISLRLQDRGDEEHVFEGVELHHILVRAGIRLGAEGDRSGRVYTTSWLMASGGDGQQAIFALAELDTTFSSGHVLLAIRRDGKALPERDGPIRIIVSGDKRRSRWVRDVRMLVVGRGE